MSGSRWYFPVYEGLFSAEHCERMGPALWLYGWIVARAYVAQNDGIINYNHDTAANDLGRSESTIRAWFSTLQKHGYIVTRDRHPYHLEIQVCKWRAVEEWWEARSMRGDGYLFSALSKESAKESAKEIAENLTHCHISITLQHYKYPLSSNELNGSGELGQHSLADAFRALLEHLKAAKNKPAVLAQIYQLCFGSADVPSYGYLGKAAKAVGGAGRLAELMWQATTKPPTGDVLAYLMASHARSRERDNGRAPRGYMTEEYIAKNMDRIAAQNAIAFAPHDDEETDDER